MFVWHCDPIHQLIVPMAEGQVDQTAAREGAWQTSGMKGTRARLFVGSALAPQQLNQSQQLKRPQLVQVYVQPGTGGGSTCNDMREKAESNEYKRGDKRIGTGGAADTVLHACKAKTGSIREYPFTC